MGNRVKSFGIRTLIGCGLALAGQFAYANYAQTDAAGQVIQSVAAQGVDPEWAAAVIGDAQKQQSILDAIARPAEKTKPWKDYRKIFMTEKRIAGGVKFAKTHAATLAEVEAKTGVPKEIIVAIIGVETYYGRIAGSYRVIDALTTLAFDYPKRSEFFTGELENFLLLAWESGKDPLVLKGSYAGAMGFGQFMPSSYRSYAADFDGDGVSDIWDNPADAIYSVANYFVAHGWNAGAPVAYPVVTEGLPQEYFEGGLKPRHTVAELAEQGFGSKADLPGEASARPMKFDGQQGDEYWLGLDNFYVITRYNHSAMYALSVFQLSQAIAERLAEETVSGEGA